VQVEEVLRQILEELKTQGQRLERLEKGQKRLEDGQAAQGERLERVEQRLNGLEQRLNGLEKSVEQRFDGLEKGQEGLQKQVTRLELRLESEAFDKIKALFDARQVHLDYFTEIRAALARLEERLESGLFTGAVRSRK